MFKAVLRRFRFQKSQTVARERVGGGIDRTPDARGRTQVHDVGGKTLDGVDPVIERLGHGRETNGQIADFGRDW